MHNSHEKVKSIIIVMFLMNSACVLSIRNIIDMFIMEIKNNYYVLNE